MSDNILIVDDEALVLSSLYRTLRGPTRKIVTELSAEEALVRLQEKRFKVVITDERMMRMQGSEFLVQVRKLYPQTVRILLTGHATLEAAMKAVNEGEIYRFLTKPWNDDILKQIVDDAINKFDIEQETVCLIQQIFNKPDVLEQLEQNFPGISSTNRDSSGCFHLPDMSDDELNQLRLECQELCR